jgi:transcriptional regulator with XRE-family HTH domain
MGVGFARLAGRGDSSQAWVGRRPADSPRAACLREAPVGRELRLLRSRRGLSQMDVAFSAGISARHLSFVETGRARPGRDVLLRIGEALSLPWDERAVLLALAGYASPQPARLRPSTSELTPILDTVCAALSEVEPIPAVLVDAAWDLLVPNAGYVRLCGRLLHGGLFPRGPFQVADLPRPNLLLTVLHPQVRRALRNWQVVAATLLRRIERQRQLTGDPGLEELLAAARALPGLAAARLEQGSNGKEPFPIRIDFEIDGHAVRCFSLVTCLATSLPGLRIELLHPVDGKSMSRLAAVLARL